MQKTHQLGKLRSDTVGLVANPVDGYGFEVVIVFVSHIVNDFLNLCLVMAMLLLPFAICNVALVPGRFPWGG